MTSESSDFAAAPTLTSPALADRVRLEPLSYVHHDGLAEAASVGELWKVWYTNVPSPEKMQEEIATRLDQHAAGEMAPWAVIDAASGQAIGMTTFFQLAPADRRLEIGHTWMGQDAHGTGINAGAKLLLLARAFEDLGCMAVEFRTHWHNHQSRAAIARLGAKQDGVLRNHRIMPNGTIRDTVVFSILESEWPAVRAGLAYRLGITYP